jgi:hypothetical protein
MVHRPRTNRSIVRSATVIAAAMALMPVGCDRRATPAPVADAGGTEAEAPPGNAVQNEMRVLHEAMRDAVTAIAQGHLGDVSIALHRVHAAREATEAAVESGAYRLPKGAEHLEEFRALDDAFHAQLEKLEAAAHANDSEATATQLGATLAKCNACHARFRP